MYINTCSKILQTHYTVAAFSTTVVTHAFKNGHRVVASCRQMDVICASYVCALLSVSGLGFRKHRIAVTSYQNTRRKKNHARTHKVVPGSLVCVHIVRSVKGRPFRSFGRRRYVPVDPQSCVINFV